MLARRGAGTPPKTKLTRRSGVDDLVAANGETVYCQECQGKKWETFSRSESHFRYVSVVAANISERLFLAASSNLNKNHTHTFHLAPSVDITLSHWGLQVQKIPLKRFSKIPLMHIK